MNSRIFQAGLLVWLLLPTAHLSAQSVADPDFHYEIMNPRYIEGKGPVVLYDEGHNNPLGLRGNTPHLPMYLKQTVTAWRPSAKSSRWKACQMPGCSLP